MSLGWSDSGPSPEWQNQDLQPHFRCLVNGAAMALPVAVSFLGYFKLFANGALFVFPLGSHDAPTSWFFSKTVLCLRERKSRKDTGKRKGMSRILDVCQYHPQILKIYGSLGMVSDVWFNTGTQPRNQPLRWIPGDFNVQLGMGTLGLIPNISLFARPLFQELV